jgi:hypothetical protein
VAIGPASVAPVLASKTITALLLISTAILLLTASPWSGGSKARAKERFERETAEHRAKLAVRDEKTAASGKTGWSMAPVATAIQAMRGVALINA